jgi:hypothetical protein
MGGVKAPKSGGMGGVKAPKSGGTGGVKAPKGVDKAAKTRLRREE